ncbi:MAG: hypothetical protein PSY14_16260 [bacterium]|nr:hypothetical protein [bacterium]
MPQDKNRVAGLILMAPHFVLATLSGMNLVYDIGLLDLSGQRTLNILLGCIVMGGEALTFFALWRPGKFSSIGPLAKLRILAFIWNILNAVWLGYLAMRGDADGMQIGEMALAIVTLGALLFFAIGPKKA